MLDNLLKKLGIDHYGQLTEEEQAYYDRVAKNLSMADPTIEDFRRFVEQEKQVVDRELYKYDNNRERDLFYKSLGRMLSRLDAFLNYSKTVRSDAVSQIQAQLKELDKNN